MSGAARTFERTVAAYAESRCGLDRSAGYVVGLSGGADSVALTLVLEAMGVKVEAVHCNFMLRGDEADRDETFCRRLCESHGLAFHAVRFDTRAYASAHKVSIEMAARELRYDYFEKLRRDVGAAGICVAHHRDDCVETVLMNLLRGTGIHGLRGILPRNGLILRPMLCVGRCDIEAYLALRGQDYVTDSTNLIDDVMRNKIRLNVIPELEKINPDVSGAIMRTAGHVAEAARVFDASMALSVERVAGPAPGVINIDELRRQVSPESTLFFALRDYGFSSLQIEDICRSLDKEPGRLWSSADYELLLDRRCLLVERRRKLSDKAMTVYEPGICAYGSEARLSFKTEPMVEGYAISRTRDCVCLDADKAVFPLRIRHAAEGDSFCPFGMKGSKLVSDYLTDTKKNLFQKRAQLVVTDASGRIVWLVGERPDNRCRITRSTVSVLRIAVSAAD